VIVDQDTLAPIRAAIADLGVPMIELTVPFDRPAGSIELDLPKSAANRSQNFGPTDEDDLFCIVQTSGTTARPKIVPLSQRAMLGSIWHNIKVLELTSADRCLHFLAPVHMMGITPVIYSLMAGSQVMVAPGFAQSEFFNWVREFNPTWFTAAPAIHQSILREAPDHADWVKPNRPRFVRSAAAAMPISLLRQVEDFWQVPHIEAYAMSECPAVCSNHFATSRRRTGSVGLPSGAEIALLGARDEILPPGRGGIGPIVVRGPGLMNGYENPADNAGVWIDGYFRTGDIGRFDEDGFLYIVGRAKEMINRGGVKISPREIEDAILGSPAVSEAVAFGIPDGHLGEEIAVAAVLKQDQSVTELQLKELVADRLSAHKVPRRVVFVPRIPTGPTGKPQRIGMAEKLGLDVQAGSAEKDHQFITPRTSLEEILAVLWTRILKLNRPISINEGFLELGGDSLQVVAMFAELNRILERNLPIAMLLATPTIEKLVDAINSKGWKLPETCVVPIQPRGTRTPLFCISGMYGHVFNYYPLSQRLGNDQPVYGLQFPEVIVQQPIRNISQLADLFLREIRQVQPMGPYQIAGYSFGGYVAYEIAQRLTAEGELVSMLGMLDTRGPDKRGWRVMPSRLKHLTQEFFQTSHKMDFLKRRLRIVQGRLAGSGAKSFKPEGKELHILDIECESAREINAYQVKPYDGPVTFFQVKEQSKWMEKCGPEQLMGWSRFVRDGRVIPIRGTHMTVLASAHAGSLAEAFSACLAGTCG
jgi:acyl-CoA synthetase (AMP-forming)/AMP-acid ligase II/thioesterase domain-containing protein/acyl carrier protein